MEINPNIASGTAVAAVEELGAELSGVTVALPAKVARTCLCRAEGLLSYFGHRINDGTVAN